MLRKYNEQINNNTANVFWTSSLQWFGRQVAEQDTSIQSLLSNVTDKCNWCSEMWDTI